MKKWKIICCLGGIISGIVSIILGINVNSYGTGLFVDSHTYGGDAYTGIQNAAADTANRVVRLGIIVQTGLTAILVVIGLALIFNFGLRLFKVIDEEKQAPQHESLDR
ncbi:MAG: hypothetical protein ACI4SP_00605 [Eubacteriales bacterium]